MKLSKAERIIFNNSKRYNKNQLIETSIDFDRDKIYGKLIEHTLRNNNKLPSECSVEDIVEGTIEAIKEIEGWVDIMKKYEK